MLLALRLIRRFREAGSVDGKDGSFASYINFNPVELRYFKNTAGVIRGLKFPLGDKYKSKRASDFELTVLRKRNI